MSIISTAVVVDQHTQPNGARYVIERHTDSEGQVHMIGPYLAPPGYDYDAKAAARAIELAAALAEAEATKVLA